MNGNFTLFQPSGSSSGSSGAPTIENFTVAKSIISDITSNVANITVIAFSGLQVGKLYNLSAYFSHLATSGNVINFTYVNGATTVLRIYSAPLNGDTPCVGANTVFSALSTTLTASLTLSGTGKVYGTTTLSFINRFVLTELNNATFGSF